MIRAAKDKLVYDTGTGQPKQANQTSDGRAIVWTMAVGLLLVALSFLSPDTLIRLACASGGATVLLISMFLWRRKVWTTQTQTTSRDAIIDFIAQDATPSFVTHTDGRIRRTNRAAERHFELENVSTLAGALKSNFANPSGVLFRLQSRASATGAAQEDVFTRDGHTRLSVHSVAEDTFVWRVEQVAERAERRATNEGLQLPMLMVGRADAVLFMNEAARALVGNRVKSLDRMFTTLPIIPGIPTTLSTIEGEQRILVAEVPAGAGRRALYLLPATETPAAEQGWHAFQDLPVPLIKVAPNGNVQSFNRIATELIGVSLVENTHLSQIMEGLGRSIGDWIKDALAGKAVQNSGV